jgi:hypothetical protein
LLKEERKMLEELRAEVARNRAVDESARILIVGIAAKLAEMAAKPTVDPAELQALVDDLKSSTDSLTSAVVENTPVE